jgi:hypothetical protein
VEVNVNRVGGVAGDRGQVKGCSKGHEEAGEAGGRVCVGPVPVARRVRVHVASCTIDAEVLGRSEWGGAVLKGDVEVFVGVN